MITLFRTQKLSVFAVVALLSTTFFGFGYGALADDDPLEELGDKLEDLEETKDSQANMVNLKQKEAELLDAQVRSLSAQEIAIEEDIKENEESLLQVERDIKSLEQSIKQKEVVIELQREVLSKLMRQYYDRKQLGVAASFAMAGEEDVLFASEDRHARLQESVGETLDEIVTLRESLTSDKLNFERKRSDLKNLQVRLEKQDVYLESAQVQKQQLLEKALTEKGKYAWRLNKTEQQIADVLQEIQTIESAKTNNLNLDSLPPAEKGLLAYPVGGGYINQYYGKPNWNAAYDFHNGVDFPGSKNSSNIYATEDGEVIGSAYDPVWYGNWIAIEHEIDGKKLVTTYSHLKKRKVSRGDDVDKGDTIGEMGNTGYSTGTHLHFSTYQAQGFDIKSVNGGKRYYGAHVNPMRYLR